MPRARLAASVARGQLELAALQGPELGSVVQGLRALVHAGQEAAESATAAASVAAAGRYALEQLLLEEAEQRLALVQAEHSAVAEQQLEQHVALVQRSLLRDIEQQEAAERAMVWAAESAAAVALVAQQPAVHGRLAEAQAAVEARRAEVAGLSEALEEKELALGRLSRELEALRDAQATADAGSAQRELGRAEAERRAALVAEQRAAWATLEDIALYDRASERRQALARVVEAEPRVALRAKLGWGEIRCIQG